MLVSEGCAELTLSLTGYPTPQLGSMKELAPGAGEQENWPHPLPAAAFGRVGHTPHLSSTEELALVVAWMLDPNMKMVKT